MNIAEIKNQILNETESLRKLQKKQEENSGGIFIASCLAGIIVGIWATICTDDFLLTGLSGVGGGLIGCLVGIAFIKTFYDANDTEIEAKKKADEISINELKILLSTAFKKVVKSEKALLIFEERINAAMSKKYTSWFEDGKLKTDWSFSIKDLECTINGEKVLIRKALINKDLSTTQKTIVEFSIGEVHKKKGYKEVKERSILIPMK